MDIEGCGALVTGGASGLGEATARLLREQGARVVIADVNAERGAALAAELGASFVQCDVREEDHVAAAVDAVVDVAGGIHIGVSCAGTGLPIKIASSKGPHPLDAFKVIVDINLIGTFNLLRLAAFRMFDNDPNAHGERGVLVNTASVAAFDGQVGQVSYSASKARSWAWPCRSARDLAPKGIRVCTIAPGMFDTPLLGALPEEARESLGKQAPFPQRLGEPSEYAQLVASIVTNPMLNGETIRLDGAIRMQPR